MGDLEDGLFQRLKIKAVVAGLIVLGAVGWALVEGMPRIIDSVQNPKSYDDYAPEPPPPPGVVLSHGALRVTLPTDFELPKPSGLQVPEGVEGTRYVTGSQYASVEVRAYSSSTGTRAAEYARDFAADLRGCRTERGVTNGFPSVDMRCGSGERLSNLWIWASDTPTEAYVVIVSAAGLDALSDLRKRVNVELTRTP